MSTRFTLAVRDRRWLLTHRSRRVTVPDKTDARHLTLTGMLSVSGNNGHESGDSRDYARALGSKLRAIRAQQHLSLHGVERKSGGRWKAVVVGSYERGDRAVSVQRLAELAEFYGVPVGELLPDEQPPMSTAPGLSKIVLNLERLQTMQQEEIAPLARFAAAIQRRRGDYGNRVLSIRAAG